MALDVEAMYRMDRNGVLRRAHQILASDQEALGVLDEREAP
jgi:hypothetical protein